MMSQCLGIDVLGLCNYDPANPAVVYFSIGDAIAALSIALVLPQFLKPIFLFRLNSRWLSLGKLYALVMLATLAVISAAILPSIPVNRSSILAYPVFWELVGACLFVTTYGVLALAVVRPVHVRRGSVERFVQSAASLLSEATVRDQVDFAQELKVNIVDLVRFASFNEWLGEKSAFYHFIHRKSIRDGAFAWSMLQLLADGPLCTTLVSHCPWVTASMLNRLASQRQALRPAADFVRMLARQAITTTNSMMTREVAYEGFAVAPRLLNGLFGHPTILRDCQPFESLLLHLPSSLTEDVVKRLNAATEEALRAALKEQRYWESSGFFAIPDLYAFAIRAVRSQSKKGHENSDVLSELLSGITKSIRIVRECFEELPPRVRAALYKKEDERFAHHLVADIAKLAYESLEAISNDFSSDNYSHWHFILEWIDAAFDRSADEPVGMDPLQQHLAIELLKKVQDNMKGWYPAVSRPLISAMDPYGDRGNPKGGSAYHLLQEILFLEWQRLSELAINKPDRVYDYLPSNVRYDRQENCFYHRYSSGEEQRGSDLSICLEPVPSLYSKSSLRYG